MPPWVVEGMPPWFAGGIPPWFAEGMPPWDTEGFLTLMVQGHLVDKANTAGGVRPRSKENWWVAVQDKQWVA